MKNQNRFYKLLLGVALIAELVCFAPNIEAQINDTTASVGIIQKGFASSNKLLIGTVEPTHLIVIQSPSGKRLNFDFAGDGLKCWGTLEPDSAATIFIRELIEQYSRRVQGLKQELSWYKDYHKVVSAEAIKIQKYLKKIGAKSN